MSSATVRHHCDCFIASLAPFINIQTYLITYLVWRRWYRQICGDAVCRRRAVVQHAARRPSRTGRRPARLHLRRARHRPVPERRAGPADRRRRGALQPATGPRRLGSARLRVGRLAQRYSPAAVERRRTKLGLSFYRARYYAASMTSVCPSVCCVGRS